MKKYVSLIVLFALFPITSAFGYEYYETAPYFMLEHDPIVCYIDIEKNIEFEKIIKQSVSDWQTELKNYTKNYQTWNIEYIFVPDNFDDDFDYSSLNCDVIVFFDEFPNMAEIGYLGSTVEMNPGQTAIGIDISNTSSNDQLLSTMTHELGHAFGLGHYITNEPDLLEKWDAGIAIPSVMIEGSSSNGIKKITELDLKKMVSIYGNDGFEKLPPVLPEWIQNVFRWYGENLVSDQELVDAIQYLVQNGIIFLS